MSFDPVVIRIHSVGPGPGPDAEQRMMLAMHFINSGFAESMARAFHEPPPPPPVADKEVVENLPEVKMTRHKCADHCVVCQEKFQCSDDVTCLPCKHKFHRPCVLPWLETHNTCPICRFELPAQEVEEPEPEKVENENEEEEEENNGELFHPFHPAMGLPPGMRMLNLPGLHRLPTHFPVPHSIMRAASAAFEAMAERRSEAVERARVRARSDDSEPEDRDEPEESEGTSIRRRRKRRRRVRTASDASTSSESSVSSSSSSS